MPTGIYTHRNKLGNTFSPWRKFEKKKSKFPFFWRYWNFYHIYFIPWLSYRPIYGNSQHFIFVLRRIQYAIYEKLHFYWIQVCLFASTLRKTQFLKAIFGPKFYWLAIPHWNPHIRGLCTRNTRRNVRSVFRDTSFLGVNEVPKCSGVQVSQLIYRSPVWASTKCINGKRGA